ncbi:MAG: glycerol-3-phosphate 1-O-acyltransferase PlsY [Calditrichaceae bacterium]
MLDAFLILVLSYLIGSFPTAVIAGKLLKNIDIRDHGSGNAGATNVFRVLGWKAGTVVLLIDMFKGFAPVFWIAGLIHNNPESLIYFQILAAFAAIAGHIWTVFAGFRGGKGVGTSAGVFLGLAPIPLVIALISFVAVVWISRYVSLGSILAALIFVAAVFVQKYFLLKDIPDVLMYLSIIIAVLIWVSHRSNIKRLIAGNENKLSFGGSGKA